MWEIIRNKNCEIKSHMYDNRERFIEDFQKFSSSGVPFKAQGVAKDGSIASVARNGWNDNDVVLTANVKFPNNKIYSYTAGKHYSGMYEVVTKYGTSIVSVTYEWRQIDEFRAAIWEAGYDEPVSFESILIRKVVK